MWSTQLLLRASHLAWTISTRERSMRSWKYTLANIDSTRKSTQKLNRVNEWIRADHKKWVAKRRWKKAPWTMKEFNFYTTSIWRDYRIKRTILQNSDDPFFFYLKNETSTDSPGVIFEVPSVTTPGRRGKGGIKRWRHLAPNSRTCESAKKHINLKNLKFPNHFPPKNNVDIFEPMSKEKKSSIIWNILEFPNPICRKFRNF